MRMTVRSAVPNYDAWMLGIDLDALERERFRGDAHKQLMKLHKERVERFETAVRLRELQGHLDEVGERWRAKEKLRRARISAGKQAKEYNFSDELIEIALRSLDANDTLREVRV